jgi:hypothetical protein
LLTFLRQGKRSKWGLGRSPLNKRIEGTKGQKIIINMSEFISSTFGKISGRHGTAVAMKSKSTGKTYLRLHSVPSDPKTAKQVAQRFKFGFVNREMNCMRNLFKITYGGNQGVSRGVSLAFNAVTGEYPDYVIDFSKLVIAEGGLNTSSFLKVAKTTGNTLKFEWDTTVGFQGDDNDGVNIVLLNDQNKIGLLKQNIVLRSLGTVDIELPAVWEGQSVHCWIYFSSPDGTLNSNSQYIDLVQL